jgi:hypothetical protein
MIMLTGILGSFGPVCTRSKIFRSFQILPTAAMTAQDVVGTFTDQFTARASCSKGWSVKSLPPSLQDVVHDPPKLVLAKIFSMAVSIM